MGITKSDIEALGKNSNINWGIDSEEFIRDIACMVSIISNTPYFKFLRSWRTSIMDITSDTIALDFFLEMYFDYIKKGKPVGANNQTKMFQKNSFILLDKLIYQYVCLQWRGSSDSKVAKKLHSVSTNTDNLFTQIPDQDWKSILNNIMNNWCTGENIEISLETMKPTLYHTYCILEIQAPDSKYGIDVDHIIPKSLFETSTLPNKKLIMNSLFNLGLLPKSENVSKGAYKLKFIDDEWLIKQIETYECIPQNKFEVFSNVSNYSKMYEYRKLSFYDKAFGDPNKKEDGGKRRRILDN